ncbi:MAG: ATP-binding protein [bacterium]|nr:ATP-binding protein [bacterium]
MFFRWKIRTKLAVGVAILVVTILLLAGVAGSGVSSYRELAKSLKVRASELPYADNLSGRVGDLRMVISRMRDSQFPSNSGNHRIDWPLLRQDYQVSILAVEDAIGGYRNQLRVSTDQDPLIGDADHELATVDEIERLLDEVSAMSDHSVLSVNDVNVDKLDQKVGEMQSLSRMLPTFLQQRMMEFADEVRVQYHGMFALMWTTITVAAVLLGCMGYYLFQSVFRPLNTLIHETRVISQGDFDHRIDIGSGCEVGELGNAMNTMTARFQEINKQLQSTNATLENEVKIRTQEAIRSERLASVGFLAAGVAHEINNPLASIAWCAESLEDRMTSIVDHSADSDDEAYKEELVVFEKYLSRIQDQAFRCKGITDSLLDYSRMSDVEKTEADLGELAEDTIEMVRHLGKYREKNIVFERPRATHVSVNPQEIKQVLLNLVTNGLDSLDPGGNVNVKIRSENDKAVIVVEDDGCGMDEEVLEHLFEPFFTRRRDGSGTGLGLSITFRIIQDHGGDIRAESRGPGQGSRFYVTFPLVNHEEIENRRVA